MQVGEVVDGDQKKEFLITGSRDKSLMIWDIQEKGDADADKEWGVPRKIFKGKQWISSYMSFLNRPLSLRQRSRFVSGQQIRSFRLMGRFSPPLGLEEGSNNQEICQPLQRRPRCCFLPRQQTKCQRWQRQEPQDLEYLALQDQLRLQS